MKPEKTKKKPQKNFFKPKKKPKKPNATPKTQNWHSFFCFFFGFFWDCYPQLDNSSQNFSIASK
jgi:hypothetical protein